MTIVPLRYDTTAATKALAYLSEAASRFPDIKADVDDLFEHRQPLFLFIEEGHAGADGITVRLEPTERLRRVVRKAQRRALRVVETRDGGIQ